MERLAGGKYSSLFVRDEENGFHNLNDSSTSTSASALAPASASAPAEAEIRKENF
jgi:hypothetical protein